MNTRPASHAGELALSEPVLARHRVFPVFASIAPARPLYGTT